MSVEGPGLDQEFLSPYEKIVLNAANSHRLLSVQWELTYRCNERCTHCYLDVFPPNAQVDGELTTQECLGVIDALAEMGVLNLTLSGGEILVRSDFFTIAEYAHSRRFLLRLFTNGILITAAVADRIAALHPYQVELSLYGATTETHERITQMRRSFELTTRAARLLIEQGVRTTLKTPVMRENLAELKALRALARDMGAGFRADVTVTPKDMGSLSPLQHRLSYAELLDYYRADDKIDTWASRKLPPSGRTCGITLKALALDPYGNVYPCLQVRTQAGNVRRQSIAEIWQSSSVWQTLDKLTLDELPVCRTCEIRNLCVRCHGLAKMEEGDFHAPVLVNCREALARRQVLIERGKLPADYPIPERLKTIALQAQTEIEQGDALLPMQPIPSSELRVNHATSIQQNLLP